MKEFHNDHRVYKPFTTDGCSGGMTWAWNLAANRNPPWQDACVEHDRSYWEGGRPNDRRIADLKLMETVAAKGHPHWGYIMYIGVRIGGWAYFPLPWRWGYGCKMKHAYHTKDCGK